DYYCCSYSGSYIFG
nr:immunoglobulin light chain junction region [Macaca mulatta]MOW16810.1 immunoglobulin light chain junction region [Macaca mulatta]MOW18080.1 immunoglobulin light chain junction region [Macaca mulatta]